MSRWLAHLRHELQGLNEQHLLRRLDAAEATGPRYGAGQLINLASNDYLGLAHHPRLKQAAIAAIEKYGTGAGASRLVAGTLDIHQQVEARFARFKHAAAGLLCPTGFQANFAALTALAGPQDLICLDKLNHASLIDAARASGAAVRVFPHRGYTKLRRLLERHAATTSARTFIVTDSVFSMDGDCADLAGLCDLADEFEAIVVVDEAHATGVLGATGSGLCELQGVTERVPVVISTASKALGGLGGIVTGPQEVIDTLINRARSFIYTTAVPAAQAAVIGAALDVIAGEPWRRERLTQMADFLCDRLAATGWLESSATSWASPRTPIIPLIVGPAELALDLSRHLRSRGVFAPAIRPPTVAPGAARVRLSLRADLADDDLEQLLSALTQWPGRK